jgi:hypothetical protein
MQNPLVPSGKVNESHFIRKVDFALFLVMPKLFGEQAASCFIGLALLGVEHNVTDEENYKCELYSMFELQNI